MLLDEKPLMKLKDVAKALPAARGTGQVNYCTVWRWALRGIERDGARVKLETICLGGTRFTSWPAVQRFISTLSGAEQNLPKARPIASRGGARAAEKKLARLGF